MVYLQIDNISVDLNFIGKITFQNIDNQLINLVIYYRDKKCFFKVFNVRYHEIEEIFSSLVETGKWRLNDNELLYCRE